jgi:hypothetical protein
MDSSQKSVELHVNVIDLHPQMSANMELSHKSYATHEQRYKIDL